MNQKAGDPRGKARVTPAGGAADRLGQLLEVEARLEARVRGAEAEARATVEAARAAAKILDGEHERELEAAARAEERVDLERHAAELASLLEGASAVVAALRAVSDAEVARLANKALAIVAGLGKEVAP